MGAAAVGTVTAVARRTAVQAILAALAELVRTAAPCPIVNLAARRAVGAQASVLALHKARPSACVRSDPTCSRSRIEPSRIEPWCTFEERRHKVVCLLDCLMQLLTASAAPLAIYLAIPSYGSN